MAQLSYLGYVVPFLIFTFTVLVWLLSWPDISKSTIYNITIESRMKLRFTTGSNIAASLLVTCLPD
jgi:hypothetical protein